jgi:hypothetical protein
MRREMIWESLLVTLAASYEEDPSRYVTLSKQTLDSALAREAISELRNDAYVEEQVRGVIRLTARGYKLYKNDPLPYAFKNADTSSKRDQAASVFPPLLASDSR